MRPQKLPPPSPEGMRYLLRLDLDLIRRNLGDTAEAPPTEDDVMRLLAGLGLWRHSDEWWGADEAALKNLREGDVIERKEFPPGRGGVPVP